MSSASKKRIKHNTWGLLAALVLLGVGLAVRLYDLTDPPLDFHPTRQLRSAIIARGMYYEMLPTATPEQQELAISHWNSMGQYEPSVLERIVAWTYLAAGGEQVWIARVYTSLFWIIGGLALFDLARRMLLAAGGSSGAANGAALAALGYYLLLPFAVQASRSFQPDPGMVMWIILSVYALYRWMEKPSWKWAVLAGIFGGVAVLTKAVAGFLIAGAAVPAVLAGVGWKRSYRTPQVWAMAGLMILPVAFYYLFGRAGRAGEFFGSWVADLSHLVLTPGFYARWFSTLQELTGLLALLIGLVGVLISAPRNRALLSGLWLGYLVYGLTLPYQTYTHSYYHQQLIPVLALSLAPAAALLVEQVIRQPRLVQLAAVGVLLAGVTYSAATSILAFRQEDFRHEPPYWQEIATHLPTDGKIIALTQDYGYRIMYFGWRKVTVWPNRGEQNVAKLRGNEQGFAQLFARHSEGKDYFLITAFKQLADQPDLEAYLAANFPVAAEGSGFLIYDLTP